MLSSYANDAKETNKGRTIELTIPSWQLGELAVKLHYGTSWIVTEYGSSDDRENDADLCACGCCCRRRGKWSQVRGRMCRLLLSACLLLCLPACRLCQHRSLFIVRSLAVLTLMPAADPIPSVAPPPSLSLSLYLCCFLSLSVLAWLGLALLGYSRCCRGRQLKLWILCVISFYWCNNQIFMMTIPADNDDDKSAFSVPSIYIYTYLYLCIYMCGPYHAVCCR